MSRASVPIQHSTLLNGMFCVMPKPKHHPASGAVRALRKHMELTQTEFAVNVLNMAISTIARWETKDRPAGGALLRLAALAEKNRRPDLADGFMRTFMEDVEQIAPPRIVERWVAANG